MELHINIPGGGGGMMDGESGEPAGMPDEGQGDVAGKGGKAYHQFMKKVYGKRHRQMKDEMDVPKFDRRAKGGKLGSLFGKKGK